LRDGFVVPTPILPLFATTKCLVLPEAFVTWNILSLPELGASVINSSVPIPIAV